MPSKPPLLKITMTSPVRVSCFSRSTMAAVSGSWKQARPAARTPAATASGLSRSASATFSGLATAAITEPSASLSASVSSFCSTLRRLVLERGSNTAQSRWPGNFCRRPRSVSRRAVG